LQRIWTFRRRKASTKWRLVASRVSVEALVSIAKVLKTTSHALIDAATAEDASGNQTEAPRDQGERMRLEIERRIAGLSLTRQHIVRHVVKVLAEEEAA
jgi:hypothetical protein